VAQPSGYGVPATANHNYAVAPAAGFSPLTHLTCPNCGFQGEGVSYFSRGGPVLGALLLAALTIFPFMGVGGLIFYLMRFNHRVCPRCGQNWGKHGERVLAVSGPRPGAPALSGAPSLPVPSEAEMSEDARGLRIAAWLLFIFGAFLMIPALGEGEPAAAVIAAISAGAGALLWNKANSAREERRERLLVALQQPVLRLAAQRQGVLTVTDVAAALNWPMPRSEKVLNSLEDGLRVASTVTDEGVIVYEFRELMHAPRMSAAEVDKVLSAPAPQPAALPFPQDGTLRA
jgi:ribosomal protein L32